MEQFELGPNECLGITKNSTKFKILGLPEEIDVAGGEIIKITRLATLGLCFVKLYSISNRKLNLTETFSCDKNSIKILSEKLASLLITIGDREKRSMICNNSDNERFLLNLKLNDVVKVNKFVLNKDFHTVCTIKYIGAVPQIGPGTFIGCTLYDELEKIDEKTKLASEYFNCNETNGFIRNCGCFFTKTMLLDQNIDNLMGIVRITSRKNVNKRNIVEPVIQPKVTINETKTLNAQTANTIPLLQKDALPNTNIPFTTKHTAPLLFRSDQVFPEASKRTIITSTYTNNMPSTSKTIYSTNRTDYSRVLHPEDTAYEKRPSLITNQPQYYKIPVKKSEPKKNNCSIM